MSKERDSASAPSTRISEAAAPQAGALPPFVRLERIESRAASGLRPVAPQATELGLGLRQEGADLVDLTPE
jgi:hypothetical protein